MSFPPKCARTESTAGGSRGLRNDLLIETREVARVNHGHVIKVKAVCRLKIGKSVHFSKNNKTMKVPKKKISR